MVTFAVCISLAKMAPSAQMLWVAINVNAHLDLKAKTVTKMSMNAPANHVKMAASARINQEVTDALVLVVGLQERTVMKLPLSAS